MSMMTGQKCWLSFVNISEVNRLTIYQHSLGRPKYIAIYRIHSAGVQHFITMHCWKYSMDITLQAYHTRNYWNNIVYTLYSTVCTLMHSVVFWCDMYALNMWFCCALSLFTLLCCDDMILPNICYPRHFWGCFPGTFTDAACIAAISCPTEFRSLCLASAQFSLRILTFYALY